MSQRRFCGGGSTSGLTSKGSLRRSKAKRLTRERSSGSRAGSKESTQCWRPWSCDGWRPARQQPPLLWCGLKAAMGKLHGVVQEGSARAGRRLRWGRLRLRRIQLGLSQGVLASRLGVSFQAVQKYEIGDIRIFGEPPLRRGTGARDVARLLPRGMPPRNRCEERCPRRGARQRDIRSRRDDVIRLVRGFYGIRDPQLRKLVLRVTAGSANSPRLHTLGYRAHRGGLLGRCRDRAIARRRLSRNSPCKTDSKASQLEKSRHEGRGQMGRQDGGRGASTRTLPSETDSRHRATPLCNAGQLDARQRWLKKLPTCPLPRLGASSCLPVTKPASAWSEILELASSVCGCTRPPPF